VQHRGNFFCFTDQVVEVRFLKELKLARNVELGAKLATRTLRDIQKTDELLVGVALIAFSDVRGDRESGTLDLVLHGPISADPKRLEDVHCQTAPALPNLEIFKRLKGHI
jgi:hypothetical protein